METLLNPIEARVLGALIEKQMTTPDYYPLTLVALTAACNQKSNRNPVTTLDEKEIARAILTLRDNRLVWEIAAAGARVMKYKHHLEESFTLSTEQQAILCELMLRGPQTLGELRAHSERLCPLGDSVQTEAVLQSLVEYPGSALAARLPRQAGRREDRYTHLLCGEIVLSPEAVSPSPEPAILAVRAENERLAALETQVADLYRQFAEFKKQFE